MAIIAFIASIFLAAVAGFFYFASRRQKVVVSASLITDTLSAKVKFYGALGATSKVKFAQRVTDFIENVTIRGIEVDIEDSDKVLVAAGAIIPIFAFPDWKYRNISEVLLYKDTFSRDFDTDGKARNVLGMVGDGAMHRMMILSLPSVRSSFSNAVDGQNTVIHEFVHLLDKADGVTDGVPEYLLTHPNVAPWINKIHETIAEMRRNGAHDVDPYGATNDAEFFAVISEYFFERPDKLQENHPELFEMLENMFNPKAQR